MSTFDPKRTFGSSRFSGRHHAFLITLVVAACRPVVPTRHAPPHEKENTVSYAAALLLAMAIVAGCEWSTDEPIITMGVLILTSASMGWFRPKKFLVSGVDLGLVVPAIAVFSWLTGVRPGYEGAAEAASHRLAYAASLLVLLVPALIAAALGKLAGSAWSSAHMGRADR